MIEEIVYRFGVSAVWPVLLLALPLAFIGVWLRRRARRHQGEIARARGAHCQIRDIAPGAVTVFGLWRNHGTQGIVEEEPGSEQRVLIERPDSTRFIADGAQVIVVGCATHQADDPRPSGYRGSPRVWVVEARGDGHFVSPSTDALDRAVARARFNSGIGALIFATGVAVAIATCVIGYRAGHELGDAVGYLRLSQAIGSSVFSTAYL